MTSRPAVLVIAGTDSSGGAGLGRDLATLAEHDVGALPAVTAVTAQTDRKVSAIHLVPLSMIAEQIRCALDSENLAAVKIGMLGCADAVEAVATALQGRKDLPVVLDPVLAASSGAPLLDDTGREAMIRLLLPLSHLVTPNIPEARILVGTVDDGSVPSIEDQARRILDLGPHGVLLKGGHGSGQSATDFLMTRDRSSRQFSSPRQDATLRGTGCTLASSIAAHLAMGADLEGACEQAKKYVSAQLAASGAEPSMH